MTVVRTPKTNVTYTKSIKEKARFGEVSERAFSILITFGLSGKSS